MVTLLLVRNTPDSCQVTNTITDTGLPRTRESGGLVYLFILKFCYYLFGRLFVFYNWLFCCFLSFITFMSFAFSYPIIFCAYCLSTSMPLDNRCTLPGIKFCKMFWINSDLSCFSVINIFSLIALYPLAFHVNVGFVFTCK